MERLFSSFSFISLVLLSTLFFYCKEKTSPENQSQFTPQFGGSVIVAIPNDVDNFNPLFSQDIIAGLINDLIFGGLNFSEFDLTEGKLVYHPNLAKSWEVGRDQKSILYHLKTNLKWSDGKRFNAEDVKYSFYLYTNPKVGSVRQDIGLYFIQQAKGEIDYDKSFEILNDSTIKINFSKSVDDPLFITGLPILPKHLFEKIEPDKISTHKINRNPIGIGPFKLEKWNEQQQIILVRNDSVNYDKIPYLSKLIFKVLPDYNSRVNQLKSGEIYMMQNLRPEDAREIKNNYPQLKVESISGRDYDYIGWNNIDQKLYEQSGGKIIKPHPLFGSVKVRQALAYALNKKEILEGFFGEYGSLALSPVSPIFKNKFHRNLNSYDYDPQKAVEILSSEGWKDTDGDKILEKNGIPFKFTLSMPSGKPHREFAVTIIKNNLEAIGISANVEIIEPTVFFNNMFEKKYDAWIAGWTIPLDLDFEYFWSSDLQKNFFNTSSYQSKEIDNIFAKLHETIDKDIIRDLFLRFQEILNNDQPVTFLYWVENLVGYNSRIKNVKLNPLAFTNRVWEWFEVDAK